MQPEIQQMGDQTLILWHLSPIGVSCHWFDPEYWQKQQKIYDRKQGRATTWFFEHQQTKAVLRHYWRGGLVGKVLQDQYVFMGIKQTRVYREFDLLTQMHQKGLNVPLPLAASVDKRGLIYRGDIITQAIEGARSLLDILCRRRLTPLEIIQIAECIADFHRHGVYHADLNINNILFSADNKVYLIDFDRGELRPSHSVWQQQNIDRLQRSFEKEARRNGIFNWHDDDWQQLVGRYRAHL